MSASKLGDEQGTVCCTMLCLYSFVVTIPFCVIEFMKTLMIMDATLEAENQVWVTVSVRETTVTVE